VVIISAADQQPPYKINGYLITQRLIYVMVRQTNRTNEEGSNDNIRLLSDSSPPHDLSLMDQQHWNEFWTHIPITQPTNGIDRNTGRAVQLHFTLI